MNAETPAMNPDSEAPLNLAVVGNCEVSALIDAQGRVVWMCLPRPDGDPVFSALLTRELGRTPRGIFAVELQDLTGAHQSYVRNTAIVETTLHDARGGSVRITDFCPRFAARGRMFRPMMLVRIVEPLAGRPLVRLRLRPTADYGAELVAGRPGSHHLRFAANGLEYRVTTDASIHSLHEESSLVLDRPLTFILGPDETIEEMPSVLGRGFLEQTHAWWRDWVRGLAVPFEWQEDVIRAAITLKLCSYEDTGAVLAALTTSIPESPSSGRTWDYRYCWLRDSYFVVQALNRLGATQAMEGYLHYINQIVGRASVGELRPVYGIGGHGDLLERTASSLEGFLGMGPVRIGNQAALQTQYDVYGSVILAASQLFFDQRLAHPGDAALFMQLESIGERAAAVFGLPDAGPWEFRGIAQTHTFSAAMSWAGCDRLARIAARLGLAGPQGRWRNAADPMREQILARGWSDRRQSLVGAFGGEDLDATTLLLPELGLLPAADPRFKATVDTIGRELRQGDLIFRYRHADDFGTPETAFTVCAFWYVNALAAVGRKEEARERFTRLLERRTPLGLLSEDVDPVSGALWGNFPQTYSLVGIVNSALRLSRSWEEAL
jgi:GH15 family glucan-1,4-alpha-glucosidase